MSDVSRAYDRWAEVYDDDRNATRDLDAWVVRNAPLRIEGRRVLEIGCGTGKNTAWLAEHAAHVTAMDFSEGMLARARERVAGRGVTFVRHDVREPWPLDDASADVVIGNLVLEHVADLAPVYAEAARVLTPGGELFFCDRGVAGRTSCPRPPGRGVCERRHRGGAGPARARRVARARRPRRRLSAPPLASLRTYLSWASRRDAEDTEN